MSRSNRDSYRAVSTSARMVAVVWVLGLVGTLLDQADLPLWSLYRARPWDLHLIAAWLALPLGTDADV